jgi:hypothetical protein
VWGVYTFTLCIYIFIYIYVFGKSLSKGEKARYEYCNHNGLEHKELIEEGSSNSEKDRRNRDRRQRVL